MDEETKSTTAKKEKMGTSEEGQERIVMTEEQIKFICKWLIENSSRPQSDQEKELLKQAVDSSKNREELITVELLSRMI